MGAVSAETQARVTKAARRYERADTEMKAARAELSFAMLDLRDETAETGKPLANEKIARMTPLSNTQVYRMIGWAESERAKAAAAES